MEQKPLFSILMANHNNGCYLQEAIDSILLQDYPKIEIVIVDDSSTDNSFEIYEKYRYDSRFNIILNKENHGVGYTKRRCVEMSKGEICGYVDPDDKLSVKDAITIMVNAHLEHPEVSMVYSGYYQTDENLVVEEEIKGMDISVFGSGLESCTWPFKHFVSFKRAAYDKTAGVDALMKRAVDYDLYYKLEEVGKVLHIDKLLYTYRRNAHSVSLNEGEYKSRAWHSYACVEAMKRRGLTEERLMLFPVEDALQNVFNKGVKHGKNTKTYLLGKTILSPFLLMTRLFKMTTKIKEM